MKLPDWLDNVWHVLGGAALIAPTLLGAYLGGWWLLPGAFLTGAAAGLLREHAQHSRPSAVDEILGLEEGWLNWHRFLEGIAWGFGAAAAAAAQVLTSRMDMV